MRKVLVTGGSRGIGHAVAAFLESCGGYEVLAPNRHQLDLADPQSVRAFLMSCPDVDALVNVAGINVLGRLHELDEAVVERMCQTNLFAPIQLIRGLVEGMRLRGGGRIVNFSSIFGVRSKEFRTLYSLTKFGITGVTRALARELGPDGILVNAVAPGYVDTEMTCKNVPPDERERLCGEIPLRRLAEPIEIAKLVRYLISEENTYLTGQTVVIDGGFLA
jgi:NAD(P)-dependent dehydrogenase (short-subunit alcohol dehydrogenase family)